MTQPAGDRETLAERVANTRARQDERQAAPRTGHSTQDFHGTRPASWSAPPCEHKAPDVPPPQLKHCWYDGPYGRQPALLLKWRDVGGRFDGLVVVAAPDDSGNWAVVEMWVEASMLAPA